MRMRSTLLAAVALWAPTALVAQTANTAAARRIGAQLGDSAGVPLVVNPPKLPVADAPWRLAEQPELVIGAVRTVPGDVLNTVRGGAVLSDRRVILAEDGTQQLRFYDPAGRHLLTAGGLGRDPGTFQRVLLVGVFAGDSLLAMDYTQHTLSVFGPDGRFARGYPIPDELATGSSVIGVLTDGSAVLRRPWPLSTPTEATYFRRGVAIDLLTPDGRAGRSLGQFPGPEAFSGGSIASGVTVPNGRSAHPFAAGDRIAVGTSDAFSVRLYDREAHVQRVVRQDRPPVPADPREVERFVERALGDAATAADRRTLAAEIDETPRHATQPAFGAVRLDRVGNLWVQDYASADASPGDWQVFDPGGLLVSRVRMPRLDGLVKGTSYFTVLDIGADYVLGRIQDDQPLERVVLYRLLK